MRALIKLVRPVVNKFPTVGHMYRHLRDSVRANIDVVDTPMGFKFAGNAEMVQGNFEPEETQVVTRLLDRSEILVNVGANIGYYCCLALQKKRTVIAFEPIAQNLHHLLRNIKANGWADQAEVFPVALSNQPGVIEIYGGGTGASLVKGWADTPESYVTLVPCTTIDNVIGNRLQGKKCLLIVDIEGAEKFMLDGAATLLGMNPKPIWMVEITVAQHQPKGVATNPHLLATFDAFWRTGYRAWTATSNSRLVEREEVERIQTTGVSTLEVHNFIFADAAMTPATLGLANTSR